MWPTTTSIACRVSNLFWPPSWGAPGSARHLQDHSPSGAEACAALARAALRQLTRAENRPGGGTDEERRCASLLREPLTAELAMHEAEDLRAVSNLRSPVHNVREAFTAMPTETPNHYADIAARLRAVPDALEGTGRRSAKASPKGSQRDPDKSTP